MDRGAWRAAVHVVTVRHDQVINTSQIMNQIKT